MSNDAWRRALVDDAVAAMRAWAKEHPEADTQGLVDDEWEGLARAALSSVGLGGEGSA